MGCIELTDADYPLSSWDRKVRAVHTAAWAGLKICVRVCCNHLGREKLCRRERLGSSRGRWQMTTVGSSFWPPRRGWLLGFVGCRASAFDRGWFQVRVDSHINRISLESMACNRSVEAIFALLPRLITTWDARRNFPSERQALSLPPHLSRAKFKVNPHPKLTHGADLADLLSRT
jgi:hypothetical protein